MFVKQPLALPGSAKYQLWKLSSYIRHKYFLLLRLSCSEYPPWILKLGGLEISGQRLISRLSKLREWPFFWRKKKETFSNLDFLKKVFFYRFFDHFWQLFGFFLMNFWIFFKIFVEFFWIFKLNFFFWIFMVFMNSLQSY